MMKRTKYLIALLAFSLLPGLAMAEKVVVIVNSANNQSLTKADLAAIYSDHVITWSNGERINSYDLPVKNSAREAYSRKVLGMSAGDAAQEWGNRKITNTAKNPPKTKKESLVILAVKKDINAIGYVSASDAEGKEGIKVVMTLD